MFCWERKEELTAVSVHVISEIKSSPTCSHSKPWTWSRPTSMKEGEEGLRLRCSSWAGSREWEAEEHRARLSSRTTQLILQKQMVADKPPNLTTTQAATLIHNHVVHDRSMEAWRQAISNVTLERFPWQARGSAAFRSWNRGGILEILHLITQEGSCARHNI